MPLPGLYSTRRGSKTHRQQRQITCCGSLSLVGAATDSGPDSARSPENAPASLQPVHTSASERGPRGQFVLQGAKTSHQRGDIGHSLADACMARNTPSRAAVAAFAGPTRPTPRRFAMLRAVAIPMTFMPRLVPLVAAMSMLVGCGAQLPSADSPSAEPARIPIIIDTDVDVSDLAAIAVLLRDPRVDIRAVTIAATGTGITNCASGRAVIRYLLEELDAAQIPFACGRQDAGPDALPFPAEWRTAADTGWGIEMPPRPQTDVPRSAMQLLDEAISGSPQPPTIVALGPWTNLEDALAADPEFPSQVARIHAMAGAVDVPGNVILEDVPAEDGLEWNIAADPSAFVAVFKTDVPLTLVPLDATDDVPMSTELIDELATDATAAGANLVHELFVRVPSRVGEGQQLWDELAALALPDPGLVTWEEAMLGAEGNGHLVRVQDGRPVRIATAADRPAVEAAFLSSLRAGAPRATPFELSGELAVTWDGTTCALTGADDIGPGVVKVRFDNASGVAASVLIAGLRPPMTWADLLVFLENVDVGANEEPPEWLIEGVGLFDDAGAGSPQTGTMVVEPFTYGPICVTGEWPDLVFETGDPFEIGH